MSNTVTIEGKEYTITLTPVEPPKPVKPKYAMTAADWKRVIDEGFLCFVSDVYPVKDDGMPVQIRSIDWHKVHAFSDGARSWVHASVMRKVGHRQPHFGGPYPGHPMDKIIYKTLKGWGGLYSACELYWEKPQSDAHQITEYIVLEEGGK